MFREKKYAHKILVEESMNIIMEKLDILNIFRNLCSIESNYNNFNNNRNIIKLSDNCKKFFIETL